MEDNNLEGQDIRFREVKLNTFSHNKCDILYLIIEHQRALNILLVTRQKIKKRLFGFIRLRLNDNPE